jgi:hypothetical protein
MKLFPVFIEESDRMNAKMLAAIILFCITIVGCVVCISIMGNSNRPDNSEAEIISDFNGVTLEVKEGTAYSTGLTLIIKNVTPDEYMFGESYTLEKQIDGGWCKLPYLDENTVWISIGYILKGDSIRKIELDWTRLYGALSPGDYRITKDFNYIRSPGDYDKYTISAEFTLAWFVYGQAL